MPFTSHAFSSVSPHPSLWLPLQFRILHGSFEFEPSEWGHISNAAKHLVCGLLTVDPAARLSMEQALNHPWITGLGMEDLPVIPDKPTFNEEFIAHSASYSFLAGGDGGNMSAGISRSGSQNDFRSNSAAGGGPASGMAGGLPLSLAQPPPGAAGLSTPNSVTSSVSSATTQPFQSMMMPGAAGPGGMDMGSPITNIHAPPPLHFTIAAGPPPSQPLMDSHVAVVPFYSPEAGFAGLSSSMTSGGGPYRLDLGSAPTVPAIRWPSTPASAMSSPAPPPIPTAHSYQGPHVHQQNPSAIPSSHSSSFAESVRSAGAGPPPLRSGSVHTEESGDRSATRLLNYATDAKGFITQVSEPLAELLGHARASLIGKHAAQIVSTASADVFQMLEVTGSCLNTPVTMLHASGSTMEVRWWWFLSGLLACTNSCHCFPRVRSC